MMVSWSSRNDEIDSDDTGETSRFVWIEIWRSCWRLGLSVAVAVVVLLQMKLRRLWFWGNCDLWAGGTFGSESLGFGFEVFSDCETVGGGWEREIVEDVVDFQSWRIEQVEAANCFARTISIDPTMEFLAVLTLILMTDDEQIDTDNGFYREWWRNPAENDNRR